jgi:DNA-binding XRE family transcriptional regulator
VKQSTVARRVEVHEITVSRWERGKARPTLRQQVRLCEAFRVSREEFGLTESRSVPSTVTWVSTPSPATATTPDDEADVRRREFLRGAPAFGAAFAFAPLDWDQLAAALARPTLADVRLVSDMHAVTREYLRLCPTIAPSALLPSVESHLIVLRRLLTAVPDDVVTEAQVAAAQTAMLAGLLLMAAGDRPNARSRFGLAEELATEARHAPVRAQVLTAGSYLDTGVPKGAPVMAFALRP